jgi:hypothetical protein
MHDVYSMRCYILLTVVMVHFKTITLQGGTISYRTAVVLSGLRVRMITPGTSEQEVLGSVVPGVPGRTPGHPPPESASQAGITGPKKQGPDAPNLGPYAPQRWLR